MWSGCFRTVLSIEVRICGRDRSGNPGASGGFLAQARGIATKSPTQGAGKFVKYFYKSWRGNRPNEKNALYNSTL